MRPKPSRLAWGLAAILATVVLGGGGVLFTDYQDRMPEHDRWVMLLPKGEWGFGRDEFAAIRSFLELHYGDGAAWPERYRLGIFTVRVEGPTPAGLPAPMATRRTRSWKGRW